MSNKLIEIAFNTTGLTDKLRFYIMLRDIIRQYKSVTNCNELTNGFEENIKEIEASRHIMSKKTLKLYTTLSGDTYMFKRTGKHEEKMVGGFEELEKNIRKELDGIHNRLSFYNWLRYAMPVLVMVWLLSVIYNNLFSS